MAAWEGVFLSYVLLDTPLSLEEAAVSSKDGCLLGACVNKVWGTGLAE